MDMLRIVIPVLFLSVPAFAQQKPDNEALQRLIPILQQQRNEAMDRIAIAESRIRELSEQLDKLKEEKKQQ